MYNTLRDKQLLVAGGYDGSNKVKLVKITSVQIRSWAYKWQGICN